MLITKEKNSLMNDNSLSRMADLAQLINFEMNVQQLSNDDIMRHLLKQDKVLDEQTNMLQKQTNDYLEIIIKQNEEIIKLLKGGKI